MSRQYDTIQGPYDYIRKKTIAYIEHENVRDTVTPFIKGARVLELACGSGFYTYDFLKWGARLVVGIDISPAMIEEARKQAPVNLSSTVEFHLADCSKPISYPGGPFDLVFGAWLLNYAPDRAGLVEMFRNIALNLEDGGHFVSVTVPPAEDPIAHMHKELEVRPPPEGSGGLWYYHIRDVDEGMYFHVYGDTPIGDVDFDCYHLKKSVYEEAAREAGLKGDLEWGFTRVPEKFMKGEGPGGASLEELQSYQKVTNYGILLISR